MKKEEILTLLEEEDLQEEQNLTTDKTIPTINVGRLAGVKPMDPKDYLIIEKPSK